MAITYPYIQYGGIWTTSQATDAVAAGTWATPPKNYLYVWGQNANGQFGLGNTTNYSSPKQVGVGDEWKAFAFGNGHSLFVKTNGTLWSSGYNVNGQLGLGNTTSYSSPKQIGALTTWSFVAGGPNASYAIKTDGTLWAWGLNANGELGLNNITSYSSPKQVGSNTWSYISSSTGNATYINIVAIRTDGSLWGWGQSYVVPGFPKSSPVQIGSATNWLKVCAGRYFAVGTKTDGTIWSWGVGGAGQMGQGSGVTALIGSPTQIGSLTNWLTVSCGYDHTVSVKTDNTAWSWGINAFGQLGLGDTSNRSSPVQIGALTNWLNVSCGYAYTITTKTDGTLWSWGRGLYGFLGLGNTTYYSSPKQVGTQTNWSKTSMPTYSFYQSAAFRQY